MPPREQGRHGPDCKTALDAVAAGALAGRRVTRGGARMTEGMTFADPRLATAARCAQADPPAARRICMSSPEPAGPGGFATG